MNDDLAKMRSITALGKSNLLAIMRKFEELGVAVVVVDTDSCTQLKGHAISEVWIDESEQLTNDIVKFAQSMKNSAVDECNLYGYTGKQKAQWKRELNRGRK